VTERRYLPHAAHIDTRPRVKLALTRVEAAAALGMSVDSFERYVQGQVRLVRLGRLVLVPVSELERWLEANASLTLEEPA
jgi:excisionase family DNA binding protein